MAVVTLGDARAELERQLQRALDSRIIIEQAKGLIAGLRDIDTEEAFHRLRKYARAHSTDVHNIANAVVRRDILP